MDFKVKKLDGSLAIVVTATPELATQLYPGREYIGEATPEELQQYLAEARNAE